MTVETIVGNFPQFFKNNSNMDFCFLPIYVPPFQHDPSLKCQFSGASSRAIDAMKLALHWVQLRYTRACGLTNELVNNPDCSSAWNGILSNYGVTLLVRNYQGQNHTLFAYLPVALGCETWSTMSSTWWCSACLLLQVLGRLHIWLSLF